MFQLGCDYLKTSEVYTTAKKNGILIDTEAVYLHFIIKQNVSVQDELLTYILFDTEEATDEYTLIK